MASIEIRLRLVSAIGEIDAAAWDACANPQRRAGRGPESVPVAACAERSAQDTGAITLAPELITSGYEYNPFISHDFLSSLERSGSARSRTGWTPAHLIAEQTDGPILGVVPCYAKTHSQGEYVFDHGWADAYERAGGSYYPKLQVCVPFTPATGRRLLVRPGPQAEAVTGVLANGLAQVCRQSEASSVHVTFATEAEWQLLGTRGYLQRTHRQFHWENAGYATFEQFLGAL